MGILNFREDDGVISKLKELQSQKKYKNTSEFYRYVIARGIDSIENEDKDLKLKNLEYAMSTNYIINKLYALLFDAKSSKFESAKDEISHLQEHIKNVITEKYNGSDT